MALLFQASKKLLNMHKKREIIISGVSALAGPASQMFLVLTTSVCYSPVVEKIPDVTGSSICETNDTN